jgi:hypothetical protein
MLHRILLFSHVLFAFIYLLAHGTSVAVAYRVRREVSAERVRALLDLSRATVPASNYMLMATLLCGIALGFLGHWWSAGWLWVAIVILFLVLFTMGKVAVPYFQEIRNAVGLVLVDGRWERTATDASPDDLARALESGSPTTITGVAIAGWAAILWMMMFKPF